MKLAPIAIILAALACQQESTGPGTAAGRAGTTAVAEGESVVAVFASPIAIEGRVVDETTRSGIAGATVIVLEPGVGYEAWGSSPPDSTASLMAGAALSDTAGGWRIDDLVGGRDYTVMIAARGYRPAVFEGGLRLLPEDASPIRIAPVTLRPR